MRRTGTMWPLENILAMNREARIDEPVNSDGLTYKHLRVKSDPVKAFLRRKALMPNQGIPGGQYYYESLDGTIRKTTSENAAAFINGLIPVTYEAWGTGVKINVGEDVHTLYWSDEDDTT
jgi:hypothetical protein